ncbi:ependymin-like isoform X1 [Poecilia reticulata]|uniref:ependymin-like isoform X1 n=1 Tax=Poecilia reticulata TaxID=8081 RepID=UPI0004A329A1|nr:PREDICTED: ependymin-like isoform X1 [Poecilia reticulata]
MNSVCVLSCFSLVLVAASGQAPKPCGAPELLTGGVSVITASGLMMTSGTVAYDALGQRLRARHYGNFGNLTVAVDELMLYNQEVMYEINWSAQKCRKFPLDTYFMPMHVPEDALLLGQTFLGSSSSWGMGLLTNTWVGQFPNNDTYLSTFTEIGCLPVTLTHYSPKTGWTTISTYNWVIGLSNPEDFFPPPFCYEAKMEKFVKPQNFFSAMGSLATTVQSMNNDTLTQ